MVGGLRLIATQGVESQSVGERAINGLCELHEQRKQQMLPSIRVLDGFLLQALHQARANLGEQASFFSSNQRMHLGAWGLVRRHILSHGGLDYFFLEVLGRFHRPSVGFLVERSHLLTLFEAVKKHSERVDILGGRGDMAAQRGTDCDACRPEVGHPAASRLLRVTQGMISAILPS